MKILNDTSIKKLIQLIKSNFISNADTVEVTEMDVEAVTEVDIESVSALDIDSAPTASSSNLVTSGGVYTALSAKATPLTGNSANVTPAQVQTALSAGNPVALTYTHATYGNVTFNSFVYTPGQGTIVGEGVLKFPNGTVHFLDLVGSISGGTWTFYDVPIVQTDDIQTSVSAASTDAQVPSAKCVYDLLGNVESAISAIRGVS